MPTTRFAEQTRVALPGSDRQPFTADNNTRLPFATPDQTSAQVAERGQHITISVLVRRKAPIDPSTLGNTRLTPEEFDAQHGADPESIALLKAFADEYHLQVEPDLPTARATIQLTGSLPNLERAFGTQTSSHTVPAGKIRTRQGPLTVPEELAPHIRAVLGLDNRPQAKPHSRIAKPKAANTSYTPVQVAQAYQFPQISAAGQTIGIIELGGGYETSDLTTYFNGLSLTPPIVTAVSVDGARNVPGADPNGADGEVLLDIEVAGAVAQGAALAVYFAPNTDQGFVDAITTAVHDTARKPSVISISWGGPESSWTQQSLTAMDEACQAAAALGVSITVACGDNGSTDGVTDGANHVDFPASSPHVLACGGTTLQASGSSIRSETVWNELASNEGATGGGVSTVFPLPSWQANSKVPKPTVSAGGRGLPDVAGDADPATGYTVRVDGQDTVIGGTSAVAPLWAGLIALANARNTTTAGFLNPALYTASEAAIFHDITQGNNGAFNAGPGWDPCTGLGSPIGTAVVAALGTSSTSAPPTHNPSPASPPTKGKKHHHHG